MTDSGTQQSIYKVRRAGAWAEALAWIGLVLWGLLVIASIASADNKFESFVGYLILSFFVVAISVLFILLGRQVKRDAGVRNLNSTLWVLLVTSVFCLGSVFGIVLFIFLIIALVNQNKLNQKINNLPTRPVLEGVEIDVNGKNLVVKNTSKFSLVDCVLKLNDSYEHGLSKKINPKSITRIPFNEFSKSDGERFNLETFKPKKLEVTCIQDGETKNQSFLWNS